MNKDLARRQEVDLRLNKSKREYQVQGSQSPSPVNYYQNSNAYDLKPPGSHWSNQFYPPNNQFHASYNPFQHAHNQFQQQNNQQQEPNLAALLVKCSERNLYHCKELLAKQLVQHVREMVTYRSGLDPYLLSAIFGSSSYKAPFLTEIRAEADVVNNEIPRDEGAKFQPPERPLYETHTQWYPASFYNGYNPRPMTEAWPEFPSWKQETPTVSGYHPNFKPHIKVPHSTDYFRPSGIHGYDPPLSFSHSQNGFRESKQFPLNSEQNAKVCNPCAPSTQNQIDIRKKPEDNTNNSTIPTSRA